MNPYSEALFTAFSLVRIIFVQQQASSRLDLQCAAFIHWLFQTTQTEGWLLNWAQLLDDAAGGDISKLTLLPLSHLPLAQTSIFITVFWICSFPKIWWRNPKKSGRNSKSFRKKVSQKTSAMNGRTMRVECSVQLKDIDTKPFKEDIICSVARGQPIPRYLAC